MKASGRGGFGNLCTCGHAQMDHEKVQREGKILYAWCSFGDGCEIFQFREREQPAVKKKRQPVLLLQRNVRNYDRVDRSLRAKFKRGAYRRADETHWRHWVY